MQHVQGTGLVLDAIDLGAAPSRLSTGDGKLHRPMTFAWWTSQAAKQMSSPAGGGRWERGDLYRYPAHVPIARVEPLASTSSPVFGDVWWGPVDAPRAVGPRS